MKTVFHVDELGKWDMALGNAKNLISYCRDSGLPWEVELVANGPAVQALTEAEAERLGIGTVLMELMATGAVIAACRNALQGNGILPGALCQGVVVVPAGVAELALRQAAGFAYIKP